MLKCEDLIPAQTSPLCWWFDDTPIKAQPFCMGLKKRLGQYFALPASPCQLCEKALIKGSQESNLQALYCHGCVVLGPTKGTASKLATVDKEIPHWN
jgi:hypothetical protein